MAKNPNISNLDVVQALKRAYDPDHDAVRIAHVHNAETSIEISAESGDSIQSVARTQLIQQADGAVGCSALRRVCMYGNGTVQVSPDGTNWFSLTIANLQVVEICAMQLKVTACVVVGQS